MVNSPVWWDFCLFFFFLLTLQHFIPLYLMIFLLNITKLISFLNTNSGSLQDRFAKIFQLFLSLGPCVQNIVLHLSNNCFFMSSMDEGRLSHTNCSHLVHSFSIGNTSSIHGWKLHKCSSNSHISSNDACSSIKAKFECENIYFRNKFVDNLLASWWSEQKVLKDKAEKKSSVAVLTTKKVSMC